MSESNKALVRRVVDEIWTAGRLDLVERLYAPDFRCHFEPGEDWVGREGVHAWVARVRGMFRDFEERVEDLVAEGDRVAARTRFSGVFMVERPDGAREEVRVSSLGVLILRIADGRVAEQWEVANMAGILGQLGLDGGREAGARP